MRLLNGKTLSEVESWKYRKNYNPRVIMMVDVIF
jgi:hypothetical protein